MDSGGHLCEPLAMGLVLLSTWIYVHSQSQPGFSREGKIFGRAHRQLKCLEKPNEDAFCFQNQLLMNQIKNTNAGKLQVVVVSTHLHALWWSSRRLQGVN